MRPLFDSGFTMALLTGSGIELAGGKSMRDRIKKFLKGALPGPTFRFLRTLYRWEDLAAATSFVLTSRSPTSVKERIGIVRRMYAISDRVESPHTQVEILRFVETILSLPPKTQGVVVEAGCFKGGSTAKFSLAAHLAKRTLVVFDSFEGIPENDEPHDKNIFGGECKFSRGDWCGTFEEVTSNVRAYGRIEVCRFVKGWFDETMPHFHEPIAAIYLDVDLASSTSTCLKYLYPLLVPGGKLYSQDGHVPLVLSVFDDDGFWREQVGAKKPPISGWGETKLIALTKEA
ncbi:Demethyldecarbamoylnovobiocin O-methyltransferase [Caballeronia arationis]|jgi:O-methyltransferase|uniref:Macrocin-O-methyltransferase (TylF) n=1 Tax=Caballeronia arationis TaxID=1777142 RepID=A0A7Z7I2I9_9BURK|nr:TylF/MycF/NovP-related O-methyltransferase [Caballeronia arationis]SAL06017.1 Demethyldecarbamoylnovobiocin O-methyltransferase [Caballeronia arationis]SOE55395.1 Macrocin-O-methyltransferase (TylF) [Caballeronia arationis]